MASGKGLVCVPCGRQVVITSSGLAANRSIWCCGKPMKKKTKKKKK